MPTPGDIKDWIEANLPGARAEVSGDGRHFDATVVYAGFAGKSRVQQQQIVYGALGDKMKVEIHALSMRTLTPESEANGETQ